MVKRKPTEADLAAREQMLKNAAHTKALAEKAQAQLEARKQQRA